MLKPLTLISLLLLLSNNSKTQNLHISKNGRYIQTQAGTPFIWIGDTGWELFHKLTREEADQYLETRARQGFTVIQAVALAENDGIRKPNAYGDLPLIDNSPYHPNEKYFKHVDYIISKAASLGLYIALLPTWADKLPSDRAGSGPIIFNQKNAESYGEFLGKRYKYQPVIWVLGGDRSIQNQEVFNIWKAMAKGLKKGDNGAHLITYHPAGEQSSSKWFQKTPWIDFNMYQSGHAHHFMPVYEFANHDWQQTPVKPFVDGEPSYEGIPVSFWEYTDWTNPNKRHAILDKKGIIKSKKYFSKGFFSAYDVRVHAYWNFLSGACGYTYGANPVWQFFKKGESVSVPCLSDWETALNLIGARQMKYLIRLLKIRPFSRFVPDQSIVAGNNPSDSLHICAVTASDSSFAIIYLAIGRKIKINVRKIAGAQLAAWWYNPKNGEIRKQEVPRQRIITFEPPTTGLGNDWILVIDSVPVH